MIHKKVCPICGKKFDTFDYRRKYCSDECNRQMKRGKQRQYNYKTNIIKVGTIIKCSICGKSFKKTNGNQKYCSKECAKKAHLIKSCDFYHNKKIQKYPCSNFSEDYIPENLCLTCKAQKCRLENE